MDRAVYASNNIGWKAGDIEKDCKKKEVTLKRNFKKRKVAPFAFDQLFSQQVVAISGQIILLLTPTPPHVSLTADICDIAKWWSSFENLYFCLCLWFAAPWHLFHPYGKFCQMSLMLKSLMFCLLDTAMGCGSIYNAFWKSIFCESLLVYAAYRWLLTKSRPNITFPILQQLLCSNI